MTRVQNFDSGDRDCGNVKFSHFWNFLQRMVFKMKFHKKFLKLQNMDFGGRISNFSELFFLCFYKNYLEKANDLL